MSVDQLGAPSVGKLPRHIRGVRQVVLVARNQHAVRGDHQIRFDEVSALFDGQRVGLQRMFRQVSAGSAVGDDEGSGYRCGTRCRKVRAEYGASRHKEQRQELRDDGPVPHTSSIL